MNTMASIKQNIPPISPPPISVALPDFRNLGFMLRMLVIANLMGLAVAVLRSDTPVMVWQELLAISAVLEPVLLVSLLALYGLSRQLAQLPYHFGVLAVLILELIVASLVWVFSTHLFGAEIMSGLVRWWLLTLLASGVLLGYFNLRYRALSPALTEARLQALQARIRPHFLFNSINAVLSIIRDDPKRAETALEDMADLFRVLMADNRQLVPMESELALCRQYLDLEKLRLGDRLRINWHLDNMPADALIPPLLLQPLLENAVYHGIEPSDSGGEILIIIYLERDEVHVSISNPYRNGGEHHAGNKMALTNIRERLALHFDYEASLTARISEDSYQVDIVLPYRNRPKP
jgi:two-component system sensor histidine kinase AlgZ